METSEPDGVGTPFRRAQQFSPANSVAILIAIVIVIIVTVLAVVHKTMHGDLDKFLIAPNYPGATWQGTPYGDSLDATQRQSQCVAKQLGPNPFAGLVDAEPLDRAGLSARTIGCPRAPMGEFIQADEPGETDRGTGLSMVYNPPFTSGQFQRGPGWWPATGMPPASERPIVESNGTGILDPDYPFLGTYLQPNARPPLCGGTADEQWRYYDGAYGSNYSPYY